MEKQTILATLRGELSLSPTLQEALSAHKPEAWYARDGGDVFLAEFGMEWNGEFVQAAQAFYSSYFSEMGVSRDRLPAVHLTDSRRGSWIMEAVLMLPGTIGMAYALLKGISELPKIADGLEATKKRFQKELSARIGKRVRERLEPRLSEDSLASVLEDFPSTPLNVGFSIDARPLRALTPDAVKSHAIHLAISMSRTALSVENLGDKRLDSLRIGLFKSTDQRYQWSFADAYTKQVPALSSRQSLSLRIAEFHSQARDVQLNLDDDSPLFVDCWIQDNSGIYLFNFYLD